MQELTLILPFPPSVNAYYGYTNRGDIARKYVKKEGKKYKRIVRAKVNSPVVLFPTQRLEMAVTLHYHQHRDYDLDNRMKGLQDALQDARVFANDSQIDRLLIARGEAIKNNAQCIITIKEII